MSVGQALAYVVPALGVIVAGFFGYRQAVKVAERNAKAASERLNLQTFESLNRALTQEIDRLRQDRAEDKQAHEAELAEVASKFTAKLTLNTEACEQLRLKLLKLSAWTDAVVRVLQHPAIAAAIAEHEVHIPPPPVEE